MTHQPTYPCLSVITPSATAPELTIVLEDLGAIAIEERDATTMVKARTGEVELLAGFSDSETRDLAAESLLMRGKSALEVRTSDVTGDEWRDNWRKYFKPVILDKIQIIAPWMKPPRDDLMKVVIDPGQAFGTGGHATTKTVLRLIEKQSNKEESLPKRILDIGTGSGVLAIAAVKLGATEVTAIDIDEESVNATAQNSEFNGVADNVRPILAKAGDLIEKWPLVLANLELSIFKECYSDVAKTVAPQGMVHASGLLVEHVKEFLGLFPGFEVIDRLEEDGWVGLAMLRTS